MWISRSEEETIEFGKLFGKTLQPNSIVCFFGNLGAGKTTFIKGIVEAFQEGSHGVNSPTFIYLNQYDGKVPIYHFDLYRLKNAEEFLAMGFDEFLFSDGISCLEWSERIAELLPESCIKVKMEHLENNSRKITIT